MNVRNVVSKSTACVPIINRLKSLFIVLKLITSVWNYFFFSPSIFGAVCWLLLLVLWHLLIASFIHCFPYWVRHHSDNLTLINNFIKPACNVHCIYNTKIKTVLAFGLPVNWSGIFSQNVFHSLNSFFRCFQIFELVVYWSCTWGKLWNLLKSILSKRHI